MQARLPEKVFDGFTLSAMITMGPPGGDDQIRRSGGVEQDFPVVGAFWVVCPAHVLRIGRTPCEDIGYSEGTKPELSCPSFAPLNRWIIAELVRLGRVEHDKIYQPASVGPATRQKIPVSTAVGI